MSTDCRTYGPRVKVSLFGYDLYEAYIGKRGPSAAWHKRKESRKLRHTDRKQWLADYRADVDTSDESLCVGLSCCGWCDWDYSWWPMSGEEVTMYMTLDQYLRPGTRHGYSKYAKSWRPKIKITMVGAVD